MGKIVIGFSGGVDSAVAAKRLLDTGEEVCGLFLDVGVSGAREDAIRTAAHLHMPLSICDAKEALYRCVCQPFLQGYLEGRTINPCLLCNPVLKMQKLLEYADEIGARYIATGHYAIAKDGALYEGCAENDQSYQLCRLPTEQLSRLILPLGGARKADIREEARVAGVPIASKPDSMDICFIPDHDYAAWIERNSPVPGPGYAIFQGERIGGHAGIHRYTVGQRWPELYRGRRLYVSEIDPENNTIVLALWEDLFHTELDARDMNWLVPAPKSPFRARVRVRHTRWEMPECTITPEGDGVHICADAPFRAPAKGQTAALYVDNRVIGAGEIV